MQEADEFLEHENMEDAINSLTRRIAPDNEEVRRLLRKMFYLGTLCTMKRLSEAEKIGSEHGPDAYIRSRYELEKEITQAVGASPGSVH